MEACIYRKMNQEATVWKGKTGADEVRFGLCSTFTNMDTWYFYINILYKFTNTIFASRCFLVSHHLC